MKLDFASPDFLARPLDFLLPLQAQDPLYWSPELNGWIVTGYKEVSEAYRDLRLSNARLMGQVVGAIPPQVLSAIPNVLRYVPLFANFSDPPHHTQARRAMLRALDRERVEGARARVHAVIAATLDRIEIGKPFDFVSTVAWRIPAEVMLVLLGVDQSRLREYHGWASTVIGALGAAAQRPEILLDAERAFVEMNAVLNEEIARRRAGDAQDDLLSALIRTAQEEGAGDDELLASVHMFVTGGLDTTTQLLGLIMAMLADDPQLLPMIRDNRDELSSVALEFIRASGILKASSRVAVEDFTWQDKQIKSGQVLFLMNSAANHDPSVWPDAKSFRLRKGEARSLAFAPGTHHCIGQLLARVEVEAFLDEFQQRFTRIVRQNPESHYIENFVLRGLKTLQIAVH